MKYFALYSRIIFDSHRYARVLMSWTLLLGVLACSEERDADPFAGVRSGTQVPSQVPSISTPTMMPAIAQSGEVVVMSTGMSGTAPMATAADTEDTENNDNLAMAAGQAGGMAAGMAAAPTNIPDTSAAGSTTANAPPIAFRIVQLELIDPPLVVGVDVTPLANETLVQPALNGDTDPKDGSLDLSFIAIFARLDPGQAEVDVELLRADCSAPLSTTACQSSSAFPTTPSLARNRQDGLCLEPFAGSADAHLNDMHRPKAPCFSAHADSLTLEFSGVKMRLDDVEVAATYGSGDPATRLESGLIRGFLPKARADATEVPEDRPLLGGVILGDALREADLDADSSGEPGYWVYLNFVADTVPYTAP